MNVVRAILICLGALLVAIDLSGCGQTPPPVSESDPVSTYDVHGVLRSFDPVHHQATVSHGAIAGYMPAMTMAFNVRYPAEFASLRPGDSLRFHLCVTARDAWIEQVEKKSPISPLVLAPALQEISQELKVGDLLPDVMLENQHGAQIHLSDFRGQVVAITFIYTRCPLPTYCPLITRNFKATQDLLMRLGTGDNWQFLSITLDPAHDTPEVLAAMAENQEADEKHWSFATASVPVVNHFGASVGLEFTVSKAGQINHNLRTLVVDPAGRIVCIFKGNTWTPQELAAEIRSVLRQHS